jgi:Domain of unknown function (DUF4304)
MEIQHFRSIAKRILKQFGYNFNSPDFYLVSNDITFVIGLQKSSYAKLFYICAGVYIQDMFKDSTKPLRYYQCPIQFRLRFKDKDPSFDLENEFLTQEQVESAIIVNLKTMNSLMHNQETLKAYLLSEDKPFLTTISAVIKEYFDLK